MLVWVGVGCWVRGWVDELFSVLLSLSKNYNVVNRR
jgi:hypothetical protein